MTAWSKLLWSVDIFIRWVEVSGKTFCLIVVNFPGQCFSTLPYHYLKVTLCSTSRSNSRLWTYIQVTEILIVVQGITNYKAVGDFKSNICQRPNTCTWNETDVKYQAITRTFCKWLFTVSIGLYPWAVQPVIVMPRSPLLSECQIMGWAVGTTGLMVA